MVAVYSPALLAPGQDALTLADLPHFPLIYGDTTETWIALMRENRVLKGDYHFSRGYSNAAVRAQAALTGQGVSIVSFTAAHQDILNGTLETRGVPQRAVRVRLSLAGEPEQAGHAQNRTVQRVAQGRNAADAPRARWCRNLIARHRRATG